MRILIYAAVAFGIYYVINQAMQNTQASPITPQQRADLQASRETPPLVEPGNKQFTQRIFERGSALKQ